MSTILSSSASSSPPVRYELRYRSLFNEGRGYAFPCDDAGGFDDRPRPRVARIAPLAL